MSTDFDDFEVFSSGLKMYSVQKMQLLRYGIVNRNNSGAAGKQIVSHFRKCTVSVSDSVRPTPLIMFVGN